MPAGPPRSTDSPGSRQAPPGDLQAQRLGDGPCATPRPCTTTPIRCRVGELAGPGLPGLAAGRVGGLRGAGVGMGLCSVTQQQVGGPRGLPVNKPSLTHPQAHVLGQPWARHPGWRPCQAARPHAWVPPASGRVTPAVPLQVHEAMAALALEKTRPSVEPPETPRAALRHPPSLHPAEVGTRAPTGPGPLRTCDGKTEVPKAGRSGLPRVRPWGEALGARQRLRGEHSTPNSPGPRLRDPRSQNQRLTVPEGCRPDAEAGGPTRDCRCAGTPAPGFHALTGHGEVVEGRLTLLQVLRPLLVADECAVVLQEEVTRPPRLDVLACGGGGREAGPLRRAPGPHTLIPRSRVRPG